MTLAPPEEVTEPSEVQLHPFVFYHFGQLNSEDQEKPPHKGGCRVTAMVTVHPPGVPGTNKFQLLESSLFHKEMSGGSDLENKRVSVWKSF